MANDIIARVDDQVQRYKKNHKGDAPLFILLSPDEASELLQSVKSKEKLPSDSVVTEYEGSKVVSHQALKPGEIQLSDELPETGS